MVRRLLAVLGVLAASLFLLAGPAAALPAYNPTTANGTVSDASPAPGSTFTFSGSGFRPGSTVTISLAGDEVATVKADASGAFSVQLTAPTNGGSYQLVASGVGPDGASRTVTATIRVVAGAAGGLPRTGTEVATQLWIAGGLVAFGAGLIALTVVRRRDAVVSTS